MLNSDYAKQGFNSDASCLPLMCDDVQLTEYGYYTLKQLPSDEERENYYKNKYYQEGNGSYETSYTEEELRFFTAKLEQKLLLINLHLVRSTENRSFLDIGCGEGFALDFFQRKDFNVLGLDYSKAGVESNNPSVLDKLIVGDLYLSMNRLLAEGHTFDVVNLDNVLEHVVNPKELLNKSSLLLSNDGIMIIKVPNDFSVLQCYFYDHKIIAKPHWVIPLDHISYFNKEGLVNLCKAVKLSCVDFLGDQLIEFSALNPNTNYFENKSVGKSCHFARIAQENIFHSISPQKTIELYRVLGDMGLGREIVGVFKKAENGCSN